MINAANAVESDGLDTHCTAARAAAEYMRSRGLGPLLDAARRRIERLEDVRGTVNVLLTDEGLQALSGLIGFRGRLGIPLKPVVNVRLAELDRGLRGSRFGVGLMDVLVADGGPIVTRRQRADEAAERFRRQLHRIAAAAPASEVAQQWVHDLAGDGPCAVRYRRLYADDPQLAERAAIAVARAIAELSGWASEVAATGEPGAGPLRAGAASGELLAAFAARLTGDPHAFDAGAPAGSLLVAALAERYGEPGEGMRASEVRAFLLSRAGLDVDDLSSTVLVANLRGSDHPVLAALAEWGGGWSLPLSEARRVSFAPAAGASICVVENPQVFAHLVRAVRPLPVDARPGLVCLAGFPSAAAVRVLDALYGAGYTLAYSGDFDRNGLVIAKWLLDRYPGTRPWRMSPQDYERARAAGEQTGSVAEPFADDDRRWLLYTQFGPLTETARAMGHAGRPAYQEWLVAELAADLGVETIGLLAPAYSG